jgi:hypothetical protein
MKIDNVKAVIVFDLPTRGVAANEIAGFICDALETWGGQFHPDDELFNSLSVKSVTVGSQKFDNPKPKKFS